MEIRRCVECNQPLWGRTDRKFCSNKCRNDHNSHKNSESKMMIRWVNRILKKNYSILAELKSEGIATALISKLKMKGFRFDHFTCADMTQDNQISYFCYDQAYRTKENRIVILLSNKLKRDISISRRLISV